MRYVKFRKKLNDKQCFKVSYKIIMISKTWVSLWFAVGEDGYTRFWSLHKGTLLYTIPPPCPVTMETIPCVQLSSRWGNRDGNVGVLMGLRNKLYFYGTLPLTWNNQCIEWKVYMFFPNQWDKMDYLLELKTPVNHCIM